MRGSIRLHEEAIYKVEMKGEMPKPLKPISWPFFFLYMAFVTACFGGGAGIVILLGSKVIG